MAKLTSILTFTGSLEGLSAYKMKGVEATILRTKWGPSKEAIHTRPCYANTRRNNGETKGRSAAVSLLMKAFQTLKPIADFDTAGQLQRLLRAVQKGDTESEYGKRAVRPSRFPQLLEGFNLTKATPFDAVVRGDVYAQLELSTLQAAVALPALLPRLTFFPPVGYPYCRLVATLGVAPDVVFGPLGWGPDGDYGYCYAQTAHTDWFAAGAGLPPTTLQLQLPYTPPTESFALVLTIAVQLGEPGLTGGVEPVHKRVGSAKILAAV
jgi:hypothetical protein